MKGFAKSKHWLWCVMLIFIGYVAIGQDQTQEAKIDSVSQLIASLSGAERFHSIVKLAGLKGFGIELDSMLDVGIAAAEESKNDSIIGRAWRTKAELHRKAWKTKEAIPFYETAYRYFEKSEAYDDGIYVLNKIIWCYNRDLNFHEADSVLDFITALGQQEKLSNKSMYTIHSALASQFKIKNEFDKAIEQFLIAEQYLDTTNLIYVASFNNNFANLYKSLSLHENAASRYKRALKYGRMSGLGSGVEPYAFDGLSIVYSAMDKKDTALMFIDSTIKYSIIDGNYRKVANAYNRKANAFLKDGSYQEAVRYTKLYYEVSGDGYIQHQGALAFNKLIYGKAQIELGATKEGVESCEEALSIILSNKTGIQLSELAYSHLMKGYAKLGNFKKAYAYSLDHYTARDSFVRAKNDREIAQMEARFEAEKKEERHQAELQQNELTYEVDLEKQKSTRNYLLAGLFGIGLLSFFLYRSNRNKKRINELLKEKQELTQTSLNEKDTLLREIHHRVKNNLQVVSSLLHIQSQNFKSDEIKQAIDQSRNRVRSMALIHQNLYQRDNLSGVPVRIYFSKLINELYQAYDTTEDRVKLHTDIDDIELDVEMMVPIGLICNELISNALKHAFPNQEEGELSVSIKDDQGTLILQVADTGLHNSLDKMKASDSMGQRLVELFCEKLKAKTTYDFDEGTSITIAISNYKENLAKLS